MNKPNMMDGNLPQAERDKLEERIIAYFEGSLDSESSSTLLKEVGESAAKRSLFHSYEVLDRVIAAARTPLEAPLEVKRGIVERIPGLLAWIPGLLGSAPALPVLTQSANPILAFFSKIPLSTAISVGTSAVVLTTAGVIVKNKLDDNAAQEARERVANVRTYEAPRKSNLHSYAPLESRELTSNVGNATASSAIAEEPVANNTHVAATRNHSSNHSNVTSHVASNSIAPAEHVVKAANHSNENMPAANKPVASQPIAAAPEQKQEETPLSAVQPLAVSSAKANAHVVLNSGSILRPLPLMQGLDYSLFVYMGDRLTALNVVDGNSSKMLPAYNFAAGVDIPVADKLSVTGKVGYTSFWHAENKFGQDPRSNSVGMPIYGTHTELPTDHQAWTTAGVSYQLLNLGNYPLFISLDLGTVFFQSQIGGLGIAGLATEIPLSNKFVVRPTFTYDVVLSSVEDVQSSVRAPRGAIVTDNKTSGQVWTSAIGFGLTITTHF